MIEWLGISHLFEPSRTEAIAGFFTPLAIFAAFFIVSLFTWRQRLDDTMCTEKYGAEKWAEYRSRVSYRILPGVY